MAYESLPEAWQVWSNDPEGRSVLAFRPDVFDTEAFPPACLPTIYVTNGSRARRPGSGGVETDEWHVTLFLEPAVSGDAERFDSRAAAVEGAVELATRFAAGELDYHAYYQLPREAYLQRLDELTGRDA